MPEVGTPSDNTTLQSVLDELAGNGWDGDADTLEGGLVRWRDCRHEAPADTVEVAHMRRMEGASDPDDMLVVVAAPCPTCGRKGVLVVHYGPAAGEADADVLAALPV
jgi:hypothetical protein